MKVNGTLVGCTGVSLFLIVYAVSSITLVNEVFTSILANTNVL